MGPVSPAGILVVRAPWKRRVHLSTSNVVAPGWQEGKHTEGRKGSTQTPWVGGWMVFVLVALLLWGSWRHLAREPLGDKAVLSRNRHLCATPGG